jgi:hypothetical protein
MSEIKFRRKIKLFLALWLFVLFVSCAEAWLAPRSFPERRYRPCQDGEAEGNVVGKFCHRYCSKYRALRADVSENCKIWKTDIKDMSVEKDFLEFRSAGFVLINETRIK